jgi:hypothetical protein
MCNMTAHQVSAMKPLTFALIIVLYASLPSHTLYQQYNFALSPEQMSQLPVLTAELCPDFHTQREDAGYVVITLVL